MPWGVSFDEQTGTFSGTPDTAGEYTVPVTVETNYGRDTKDVLVKVKENVDWEKVQFNILYGIVADTPVTIKNNGSTTFYHMLVTPLDDITKQKIYLVTEVTSGSAGATSIKSAGNYGEDTYISKMYNAISNSDGLFTYMVGETANGAILCWYNQNSFKKLTPPYSTTEWYAACYCSNLNRIFYFSKNGVVVTITNAYGSSWKASILSDYVSIGITNINPNCAAYSPISGKMCVSSSNNMVATSYDGVTWETAISPDNFTFLEYRSDLGKFVAFGKETKLFYISENGLTWEQYNNTPVPLNDIQTLSLYSTRYGYCSIGTRERETGVYSALSVNLEDWTFKKITNDNVRFKNVIYASHDSGKLVAAPINGGNYLYQIKY